MLSLQKDRDRDTCVKETVWAAAFGLTGLAAYLLTAGQWALGRLPVGQLMNGEKSTNDYVPR